MAKKKTKAATTSKKKKSAKASAPRKSAKAGAPAPAAGSWAWHELMTPDVAGARQFYGKLFGWTYADMPMGPGMNYTLVHNQKQMQGGMMAMSGPEWTGVPPHWMIYVAVDNVDATAARCAKLGGKVCVPPTDIPVGRFSVLTDPQGATISVYKSK